jgi:hypothetical protein
VVSGNHRLLLFLRFSRPPTSSLRPKASGPKASRLCEPSVNSLSRGRCARGPRELQRRHVIRNPRRAPARTSSTRQLRGVDSSCESAGRPDASCGDCGGHRHRGMGSGRPSAPSSSRAVPRFWSGIGRCTLRMRGSCRRSWSHIADGMVRDRAGRNDRCGRHRDSVRPAESSNGLAVTFRRSAWK